jgi:homoserine kinase
MNQRTNDVVRVFAPATVANLGPGFDVLGLAIRGIGDTVEARRTDRPGLTIAAIHGDGGVLPLDAARNTAGIAAAETLRRAGVEMGIELEVFKGMPIGSGLGSSAASAAAAAVAVNHLLGNPLRRLDLVACCVEAEAAVAGRHADNVAPAVLGGLVLVQGVDELALQRLPVPAALRIAVVTPVFSLETRLAREALPTMIPLSSMVTNAWRIATFVSACYSGDLAAFAACVQDDVVTPARAALIPGAPEAMRAARESGAIASSISGSGPSVFALCHSDRAAHAAATAMIGAFRAAGLDATAIVSPADCPGAVRVDVPESP